MGKRNTAIKGCKRCKKLVPTATRYCRCGFDFKKPNPDAREPPAPPPPPPAPEISRRKSERRQRITVKPDFYSPSDYENPFKKTRRRTTSDTSHSDECVKRKRGRPKQVLTTGLGTRPTIKSIRDVPKSEPTTPNAESKDGKKDREKEPETDPYANIPSEKILQYTVILAEINRKVSTQGFKP